MDIETLKQQARELISRSYSPYSRFPVAAVFCDKKGQVYGGVNVENMSFGLSNCAERSAIFSAAAQGAVSIETLVIYTPTPEPTMPCGACRQVIREFSDDAMIVSFCDSEKEYSGTISELLPGAFLFQPGQE